MSLGDILRRAIHGDDWSRADEWFRERHTAFGSSDLEYERVRPAYEFGYLHAMDERFAGRPFEEAEAELHLAWSPDLARQCGSWDAVRGFVQRGYRRALDALAAADVDAAAEVEHLLTPEELALRARVERTPATDD